MDTDDFADVVAKSKSVTDVLLHFGLDPKGANYRTFKQIAKRRGIDYGHFDPSWKKIATTHKGYTPPFPDEVIFQNGSTASRHALRRRLLSGGYKNYECAECGLAAEWRGKPIVLVLDHINGINDDNRVENLRFLCPNCDSQSATWRGRNIRIGRSG